MPVSGWSSRSVYGWRMIYYSMGGATLLVSFLWSFLTASTPAQHKQITEQERRYIESSLRSNEEKRYIALAVILRDNRRKYRHARPMTCALLVSLQLSTTRALCLSHTRGNYSTVWVRIVDAMDHGLWPQTVSTNGAGFPGLIPRGRRLCL